MDLNGIKRGVKMNTESYCIYCKGKIFTDLNKYPYNIIVCYGKFQEKNTGHRIYRGIDVEVTKEFLRDRGYCIIP